MRQRQIPLKATITFDRDCRGRRTGTRASLGLLDEGGADERVAVSLLAATLEALATNAQIEPIVRWSLDLAEVMIGYFNVGSGWWYTFIGSLRAHIAVDHGFHLPHAGGVCGPFPTRNKCLSAMSRHWYQINVEPIVTGILALGGYRAWNCQQCGTGAQAWPDADGHYRCPNPGCRNSQQVCGV